MKEMKQKESYLAPSVKVVAFKIEKGFDISMQQTSGTHVFNTNDYNDTRESRWLDRSTENTDFWN